MRRPAARCSPPSVTRLREADIAFSGTLSIEGPDGVDWVLTVDRWYTGGDEDVMVVQGSDVSIIYFAETVAAPYAPSGIEDGDRLLVAGTAKTRRSKYEDPGAGYADACLTEAWTDGLVEMFAQAFPSPSPRPRLGTDRKATPR